MMGYLSLFFPILSDGIQVSEDLICTKVGWCEKQDNLRSLICSERVYNAHKYEEIITSYEEQIAHIETCKKTINVETAPEKTTLIELKK